MKQVVLFMALLFGWVAAARADAFGPIAASGAISANGKYVVRLPEKYAPDSQPELSIHAYDEELKLQSNPKS